MSENNEIPEKNNAHRPSAAPEINLRSCPTCKSDPCHCPGGGSSGPEDKDTEAKSKDSESRKKNGSDVLTLLTNSALFTPQKLGMAPTPKASSKRIDEEDLNNQEKPAPEVDNEELQADIGELQVDTVKSSIESPFAIPRCTPPGFTEKA